MAEKVQPFLSVAEEPVEILGSLEWTAELDVALKEAIFPGNGLGSVPTGINKHFIMFGVRKRFEESTGLSVDSSVLWQKLNSDYKLSKKDACLYIPFPNQLEDFSLPEDEFGYMINPSQELEKMLDEEDMEVKAILGNSVQDNVDKESEEVACPSEMEAEEDDDDEMEEGELSASEVELDEDDEWTEENDMN